MASNVTVFNNQSKYNNISPSFHNDLVELSNVDLPDDRVGNIIQSVIKSMFIQMFIFA
jgi:hypothetical protein